MTTAPEPLNLIREYAEALTILCRRNGDAPHPNRRALICELHEAIADQVQLLHNGHSSDLRRSSHDALDCTPLGTRLRRSAGFVAAPRAAAAVRGRGRAVTGNA